MYLDYSPKLFISYAVIYSILIVVCIIEAIMGQQISWYADVLEYLGWALVGISLFGWVSDGFMLYKAEIELPLWCGAGVWIIYGLRFLLWRII